MRHQSHSYGTRMPVDAARQVAQLRHVLSLIEALSGREDTDPDHDVTLDEAARMASAFQEAEPIVRRRFGILAAEITAWSTAGVEALLAAGEGRSPAAARRLADELERGLTELILLLQPEAAPGSSADGLRRRAIPSP